MKAKEQIRKLIEGTKGRGYANACQIWKGYGDLGQAPNGWWLKPFNQNAQPIGANLKEVEEMRNANFS